MRTFVVTLPLCSMLLILASTASHAQGSICSKAKERLALSTDILDAAANEEGNVEIAADIDHDGKPDRLLWYRTGSASLIPPDYSRVTLALSSNGISYFVEGQWVSLVKYRGGYYAVTTSLLSEAERGPWRSILYSVDARGMSKLCAFDRPRAQP